MHYVYHLVDPDTKKVKYIGKSTNPKSRLKQHIKESIEKQNTEKKKWIYRLKKLGMAPVLVVVGKFDDDKSARYAEGKEVEKHISTILNIHHPHKGKKDIG